MSIRMQITPDDFKRAQLVKPGWYAVLIQSVTEEMNAKKDAMNVIFDVEVAEPESEFMGVPIKHWFSEKGVSMPGGAASFFKAENPKGDTGQMQDLEFTQYKGTYIYAKVKTDRGADGQGPPRNAIEDWAPLPAKLAKLNEAVAIGAAADVAKFGA